MNKYIIPSILLIMALSLSTISAYYSVIGLVTIFAGGMYGFIILEASKVAITAFLHHHWNDKLGILKYWLVAAVIVLMLLTSMGIFGQLSKSSSKNSESVTVNSSKVIHLEESILREKNRIDQNIKQIDMYNQSISRLITDNITQASKERRKMQAEISTLIEENKVISNNIDSLSKELLPYKSEVQKHEVEIGPLIYITKLIYGEEYRKHSESTLSVLIIMIVLVFDPLAISMLIASQKAFKLIGGEDDVREELPKPKKRPEKKVEKPVVNVEPIFDDEQLKMEDMIRRKRERMSTKQHQM